jgi:SOS response regulatory protein OraA/RecX
VREAAARLASQGFLDDVAAARSTVRTRGVRYGRARVERELKARGFGRDAIAEAFEAEGGAEREDEALRKAFQRLWSERTDLAPRLRRRKVFDALTRRGFSADRISDIIRKGHEID